MKALSLYGAAVLPARSQYGRLIRPIRRCPGQSRPHKPAIVQQLVCNSSTVAAASTLTQTSQDQGVLHASLMNGCCFSITSQSMFISPVARLRRDQCDFRQRRGRQAGIDAAQLCVDQALVSSCPNYRPEHNCAQCAYLVEHENGHLARWRWKLGRFPRPMPSSVKVFCLA